MTSFSFRLIFVLCTTLSVSNAVPIQPSMESLLSRLSNISEVSSCASTQLSIDLLGLMRLVASDAQRVRTWFILTWLSGSILIKHLSHSHVTKLHEIIEYFASNVHAATSLDLVELGGRNYFFSLQDATFFDGLVFCNAYGMELATIETAEENKLVIDHLTSLGLNTAFISGHKIGRGSFAWSNGTPINFSYWDAGEPDHPEAQHCIVLHNKKWHNAGCLTPYKFVCEQRN